MARVKLSFAFIRAFDAHLYRAGSGSEAVLDRQEWPALARMPMQWRRPEPDVLRHSQGETGNQATEREIARQPFVAQKEAAKNRRPKPPYVQRGVGRPARSATGRLRVSQYRDQKR
ncbi:hypothetical protein [Burkholderia cenocepacia]|uniref:hypothetical protein n=1 Tax=Burkholderia cenocepacia TaxID=95486 RepID=UPI00286F94A0|nr:hypothetical protein [Burkholderia cenocepacia]